jgi:hypothetical protein
VSVTLEGRDTLDFSSLTMPTSNGDYDFIPVDICAPSSKDHGNYKTFTVNLFCISSNSSTSGQCIFQNSTDSNQYLKIATNQGFEWTDIYKDLFKPVTNVTTLTANLLPQFLLQTSTEQEITNKNEYLDTNRI